MERTWIVVCDAARARFFMVRRGSRDWEQFDELKHPASRAKGMDLVADRPGRQKQMQGQSIAGVDWRTDPRRVEELRFASEIAEAIDGAFKQNVFERLVLVAPPHFLGMVRAELPDPVQKSVWGTIDRDYASLKVEELAHRISVP